MSADFIKGQPKGGEPQRGWGPTDSQADPFNT